MKKIASLLIIILIASASTASAKKARKFYLTQDTFTGSQALTACANKFHMASLWEIFNTSTLRYDTENGLSLDDSGTGPPVSFGWARTGVPSDNGQIAGVANCLSWTTDTGNGSVIILNALWNNSSISVSPWRSAVATCSTPIRVWCVQD